MWTGQEQPSRTPRREGPPRIQTVPRRRTARLVDDDSLGWPPHFEGVARQHVSDELRTLLVWEMGPRAFPLESVAAQDEGILCLGKRLCHTGPHRRPCPGWRTSPPARAASHELGHADCLDALCRPLWHRVMLTFGQLEPIECACGLDYNPATGKALPRSARGGSRCLPLRRSVGRRSSSPA